MKKVVFFLPLILAAVLVTLWLIAKSSGAASRSSPTVSQVPAPQRDAKGGKDPKKLFPLPPAQESESAELKEARALLAQLSQVAKRLENEGVWIQQLRAKTSEPDATMWKLRLLGHRHPEAMNLIEQFVRSDEPLAARIFAVFSFVAPQNSDAIEFVASLMRAPPSSELANASCLCFDVFAANGIGGAWNSLLGNYSGMLGFPKARMENQPRAMYGGEESFAYFPEDWKEHVDLYKSHSFKLDLTSIVSSILTLLSNADEGVWRNKWLNMAWQLMNHPKATAEHRDRLREITVKWYLEYDPGPGWDPKIKAYRYGNGWVAAMESLTKAWSPDEVKVVGAGLARLSPEHKTYVFDEVAHRAKSRLFEPPFSDHLEDVLTRLEKPPIGPQEGSYLHVCVSMIVYAPSEEWSRALLARRGPVLRQRISDGIASWANGGDYKLDYGRRFFSAADFLIADTDFGVRYSAACTLCGLLRKRDPVLTTADSTQARVLLKEWSAHEKARPLSPEELKRVTSLAAMIPP